MATAFFNCRDFPGRKKRERLRIAAMQHCSQLSSGWRVLAERGVQVRMQGWEQHRAMTDPLWSLLLR